MEDWKSITIERKTKSSFGARQEELPLCRITSGRPKCSYHLLPAALNGLDPFQYLYAMTTFSLATFGWKRKIRWGSADGYSCSDRCGSIVRTGFGKHGVKE
jgi:hypothetical protein